MKLNAYLIKATIVGALGGLLFGFDTAVIAGTTHSLSIVYNLTAGALGLTVSIALWGTVVGSMTSGIIGQRLGGRDALRIMAALYLSLIHIYIGIIQRNAVTSWTRISPRPEIILFGDETGTAEIAREFVVRHVPDVKRNDKGTPYLSDLFEKAQSLASHPSLCYVNADICLLYTSRCV